MPRSWRITKTARVATAFDGEGARTNGGRWNSPGTLVVYTAQTESLAALELLVHLRAADLLKSYSSIPVSFEDSLVEVVDPARLPSDWKDFPAPSALQRIGDRWVAEQRSVVLRVPSAIVPSESNFLLNPRHSAFGLVAIGPANSFQFDRRLK
jgi:RES domain-containing protein